PQGGAYVSTFAPGGQTDAWSGDGSLLKTRNEIQRVQVFNANGGSYALTFKGAATGIAYNASTLSGTQQTALGCDSVCAISGSAGDYTITFNGGSNAGKDVDQVAADKTNGGSGGLVGALNNGRLVGDVNF